MYCFASLDCCALLCLESKQSKSKQSIVPHLLFDLITPTLVADTLKCQFHRDHVTPLYAFSACRLDRNTWEVRITQAVLPFVALHSLLCFALLCFASLGLHCLALLCFALLCLLCFALLCFACIALLCFALLCFACSALLCFANTAWLCFALLCFACFDLLCFALLALLCFA